jgi:hypothetical protein
MVMKRGSRSFGRITTAPDEFAAALPSSPGTRYRARERRLEAEDHDADLRRRRDAGNGPSTEDRRTGVERAG